MTTFWGEIGDERLVHTSPDDAIESIIDSHHPATIDEIGDITVHEFAPVKPQLGSVHEPLETLLERLDEEYGDPEGDGCEPTAAMLAAQKAFVDAVLAEYVPWACEPTGNKLTVNALEWAREHAPEWLNSESRR